MAAVARAEVKPGQTWRWLRPDGLEVEMFVERIQLGPYCPRAFGYNTTSRRRMQLPISVLRNGDHEARLVSEDAEYVWKKART